jgi:hypothetical protein
MAHVIDGAAFSGQSRGVLCTWTTLDDLRVGPMGARWNTVRTDQLYAAPTHGVAMHAKTLWLILPCVEWMQLRS